MRRKNIGNTMRYEVPQGMMLAHEFCSRVGIARSTLQSLRKKGIITPSGNMQRGKLIVQLYSPENVEQYREYTKPRYKGVL